MMRDRIITLGLLVQLLFLPACRPEPAPTATPVIPQNSNSVTVTYTPEPSQTPTPTDVPTSATPTPSPTITFTPTPTEFVCRETHGVIEEKHLESQIYEEGMVYRVYTPPCYKTDLERDYPVVYLMHGLGSTADQWDRLGVDERADELIASGEIAPLIIVFPQDELGLRPSRDPFGDMLLTELIPQIDADYRTRASREYRALGGLSRGGNWAVHLGYPNWALFGAIGAHSTPAFLVDDANVIRTWLAEIPRDQLPRIYLDVGDKDLWLAEAMEIEMLVDEADIPHEWYLFSGYHDEEYWGSHVEQYLRWYSAEW